MNDNQDVEVVNIETVEWVEGSVRHLHTLALDQPTQIKLAAAPLPGALAGEAWVQALRDAGARRVNTKSDSGEIKAAVRRIYIDEEFEFYSAFWEPNWGGKMERLQNQGGKNAITERHPLKKHVIFTVGHDAGRLHGEESRFDYETGTILRRKINWDHGKKAGINNDAMSLTDGRKVVLGEFNTIDKFNSVSGEIEQTLTYSEYVLSGDENPVSLPHGGTNNPAKLWRDAKTEMLVRAVWCDVGHEYHQATADELKEINTTGKFPTVSPV